MKTHLRSTLALTVLGGLVSALGAIVFLPAYAADAELAALVIGALAIYALGAMALVEYNRPRVVLVRRAPVRVVPTCPVVVRWPARRRADERIAA